MAGCVGRWELSSSDGFAEYMKAIGVTPENIEKAKSALSAGSKLVQDLSNSGTSWTLKTITSAGEKEITFNLGEEFSTATLDGRPVKVVVTEEGGTLVEVQKGDGFETKNVRTVAGDELVMTMTGNGVTCTRKYKKIG
ncbi:fatty acid-binding protein, heart-like isoform X1 [Haliotis rufescens]|uniref:fatty acid-binding protein, heart-like isoform X1 n=1 Tax=Haliotis rufescens TaxID=6454 RepID=UPI001EB02579|nr:fatty acid-binding protein, heart-like isoform X1 [Haliotis rufescens]